MPHHPSSLHLRDMRGGRKCLTANMAQYNPPYFNESTSYSHFNFTLQGRTLFSGVLRPNFKNLSETFHTSVVTHYSKLSVKLRYTINYTTLHYSTLHYTTLNCTTVKYSTLRCTELQYGIIQYTELQYRSVQYITLHLPSTTTHHCALPFLEGM